ncbi:MFS transporter [Streptomyces sp. NRRL S-646]|uniref:MFS transporter n=1 Tax=Streptomyces sp. NRRL S-646 TaxID=1463917 RepID=UPI0005663D66|nr:MFS transporter [Streptomyces sp. NRRL S-646]
MSESKVEGYNHVPAAPSPGTRTAGLGQALILLLARCMGVLGAVLLTPVLPKMQDAFDGTAGADILVPVTLTAPALMIGLLSLVAGSVADRLGRKGLLVGALLVYALVGTAPLWLDSLPLIVGSRVLVGVCEAAIMTCCTTLIADHFDGHRRDKYLGLQVVFTNISAIAFFGLGGVLGGAGWRTPFWLYAVGLALAVLVALFVRQPASGAERGTLQPVPWRSLRKPVCVSLLGGVVFYTPIVELSYVLDGIGVESTATIGQVSAASGVATALGGVVFGRVSRSGPRTLLPLAFGLAGAGLVGMALGSQIAVVAVGAVIACAGTGLLLPTLLTWAISSLGYEERGRGTGLWTAAFGIGQFFCPLAVLALSARLGGLSAAITAVGAVSLAMALAVVAVVGRSEVGTFRAVTADNES